MEPVRCTLTTKQASRQLVEWHELVAEADRVTPVEHGVEIALPTRFAGAARDLAAREVTCCSFLTIDVDADDQMVRMHITAPTDAGRAVIERFLPS